MSLGRIFVWDALGILGITAIVWRCLLGRGVIFIHGSISMDFTSVLGMVASFFSLGMARVQSVSKKSLAAIRAKFKGEVKEHIEMAIPHFKDLQKALNGVYPGRKRILDFIDKINSCEQQFYSLQCVQKNAGFAQILEFDHFLKAIPTLLSHLFAIIEDGGIHIRRGQSNEETGNIIKELLRLSAIVNG